MVEADAGGECEESGRDPGEEVARGAGAVAFECEEVFAGPEDRLDSLSDRREVWALLRLVAARWPRDLAADLANSGGELAAGVALVTNDRLAAGECAWQQRERDLPLGPVGGDQGGCARCPIGCAGEMQSPPQNQREWLRE